MGAQQLNLVSNFNLGGIYFSASVALTGDLVLSAVASVPAAQPGSLTVRTDNATGTLTMTNSSHGITTGIRIDLYWSGGCRRGVAVGTVSGTSVPITVGSGDNLPAAATAIVASIPVKREIAFLNASLQAIAVTNNAESQFTFVESNSTTEDWTQHITPATSGQFVTGYWYTGLSTLPLTGTAVFYVYMSHADTAAAHNMSCAVLTN